MKIDPTVGRGKTMRGRHHRLRRPALAGPKMRARRCVARSAFPRPLISEGRFKKILSLSSCEEVTVVTRMLPRTADVELFEPWKML